MNAIGLYAAQGLALGLQAGAGQIYAVANQIAANITRTLQAALKVNSPSRVTRLIGRFVSLGLALGLEDLKNRVAQAADAVAAVAVPDIAGSDLRYAFAGGIDLDSSISPAEEVLAAAFSQPINIIVESTLDGKKVGEGTAVYSRAKIRQLDKEAAMRRGER